VDEIENVIDLPTLSDEVRDNVPILLLIEPFDYVCRRLWKIVRPVDKVPDRSEGTQQVVRA
jgi:hypothetical protein